MKIARVLVFSLLMLPMMGADGNGCGAGDEQPGVLPSPEPKCSPQTCAEGCCLGDLCYTNEAREACGSFGVVCAMCQGLQGCQKDSVKGWQCLADLSANWAVQPVAASIPLLDPSDGSAWDADDSEPDVVVEMSCPADGSMVIARTSEVSSYTPTWSDGACVAKADGLLNSTMDIKVIDVDAFFDDPIFSGSYAFKEEDFDKGWVEIPISADGGSKLRLQLSRSQ